MKSGSAHLSSSSTTSNPAAKKQRQSQQPLPLPLPLPQGQQPAAPLDVPPPSLPVREQVGTLLDELVTAAQTPSIAGLRASVNRILSSVQSLPDVEACFELLNEHSIHDADGKLSSTLAALCMRYASADNSDALRELIGKLLTHSSTEQQHQAVLSAILENANHLPLSALGGLVSLLKEMHESLQDLPLDMRRDVEELFRCYGQREVEAGMARSLSASADLFATLSSQSTEIDDPTAINTTGPNVQARPVVQVIPIPHQVHPPLAEGHIFSISLPGMLNRDPGELIINRLKPAVGYLLPPQSNRSLQRQGTLLALSLVNRQIHDRVKVLGHPEVAALAWCLRLNRFEETLNPSAVICGALSCLEPSWALRRALVELVAPDPNTAVALEHRPKAPQRRIEVLTKRLISCGNVNFIKDLVDALISELARQDQLSNTVGFAKRALVDLRQFMRCVIVAAMCMRCPTKFNAVLRHINLSLRPGKLPPEPLAECLIELCVHYHTVTPGYRDLLRSHLKDLVAQYPDVMPLETRLDHILEFMQAPMAASEESVAKMLEYLRTTMFWGPSEFEPLLLLARRAAPGAAAPLPEPLQKAVEKCIANFIIHACSLYYDRVHSDGFFSVGRNLEMDEIGMIGQLPVELLRRVFPRLDLRIRLMITMQRRVHPIAPGLFPLVRDLVSDSSIPRLTRSTVVWHWLEPITLTAGLPITPLQQELQDMYMALQQPGVQHGNWLIP